LRRLPNSWLQSSRYFVDFTILYLPLHFARQFLNNAIDPGNYSNIRFSQNQLDFAPDYASIPPHGRWQHFKVGGHDRIADLLSCWPSTVDQPERCRRLLDLFLVSVLLDAGAGTSWSYKSNENGRVYKRSEGLAIASLEMFKSGIFSSDQSKPH
jgi:hypothetical protein